MTPIRGGSRIRQINIGGNDVLPLKTNRQDPHALSLGRIHNLRGHNVLLLRLQLLLQLENHLLVLAELS